MKFWFKKKTPEPIAKAKVVKPVKAKVVEEVVERSSTYEQAEALLISQYGPYIRKNCAEKWPEMVEDTARKLDSAHSGTSIL